MYSIQEVSQKTGLSAHTLRYYEKEGLITGVERSRGGFRQYTDEDLEALGLVCCLKNTGMSLQEIRTADAGGRAYPGGAGDPAAGAPGECAEKDGGDAQASREGYVETELFL